ncbi:MAG TPA: YegS/Rv2252/BmrU family lipid kinase [Chitinophagaceae bacterium]|nr:YegS/Rv2252/BmrU family lipid kinase [Chitinophagaceae bacterium]
MARKFIFLINPISGTSSRQRLPDSIAQAAKEHNAVFEILPTVASGDYQFVKQKIREEKVTDIIICGGDGSVNSVVQDLKDMPVNFGIVPLGSGNGLALSAKIPVKTALALEIVFTGVPDHVDAFLINQSFACMLCGLGFDAQVAHNFAKQKKRGLFTYAQQSLKQFFVAKPYSFGIDLGDTEFTTESYFISIANSNQFGNQVTIAPLASLNDGLLDIVIVRKMNKAQLPLSILDQIAGRNQVANPHHLKKSGIIYLQTDKLSIKNIDGAPLHIDGEPRETASYFNIRVLPNCFKLLQPPK